MMAICSGKLVLLRDNSVDIDLEAGLVLVYFEN
jgi:hypothetical protein